VRVSRWGLESLGTHMTGPVGVHKGGKEAITVGQGQQRAAEEDGVAEEAWLVGDHAMAAKT